MRLNFNTLTALISQEALQEFYTAFVQKNCRKVQNNVRSDKGYEEMSVRALRL